MTESSAAPADRLTPAHPRLLAVALFVLPVLVLCWPVAQGLFLGGMHSDQYVAGFSFRDFGAEYFREHGRMPQWNPYLFGGMPFIGAMHGDIFYPTAWLRWILPTGTAMGLGMALHLVLAGTFLYALLRRLGLSWGAAVAGGLAYELSGIVASMVHPGHDGKLYVAALAPALLLSLVRAIRHGDAAGYGLAALITGLSTLTPHPQMTYYLLVAAGLWSLWLAFFDGDTAGTRGVRALGMALGAVLLGAAIGAIQYMPFYEYIPFSPRGTDTGWEYATSYALPPLELVGAVLAEFNGVGPDAYWGSNFFKLHSEYLGIVVVGLAALGAGGWRERRFLVPLAIIAALFLLVALGGHTPFYRLWYEVMPFMKKVRAAGMAFFLVALPVAIAAAVGVDRLVRGEVAARRVLVTFGALAGLAVLAVTGVLQAMAEGLAAPQMMGRAAANADALRVGGLRALCFVLLGGGLAWAVASRRLAGWVPALGLAAVLAADLWSVERKFFVFERTAEELFAPDAVTAHLDSLPRPYRVFDAAPQNSNGIPSTYPGSWLMARRVPVAFGYHGNEVRFYDELWGGKNVYASMLHQGLWSMWGINHVIIAGEVELPGFDLVMGPVPTTPGGQAWLYRRSEPVPYARVVGSALKVPDAQLVPTVVDPRFPADRVVLLPDTASASVAPLGDSLPAADARTATVTAWEPGRMTVEVAGEGAEGGWLLVPETWYVGWGATVNGQDTPVHRGNGAMLAVQVPAGASTVELAYRSATYARGAIVSLFATALALGLVTWPAFRRRAVARA